MNMQHIVDEYVAVWNEPDPQTRRRRIRSVWAPDGTTCYRLMDARGAEAIEVRVAQSWDKWLKESKYVFRPQHFVCHHDAIKLQFVLVKAAGGAVEANGVCYLLLNPDGRIRHDYQFNPSANEPNALIDRYLAALNEPDPGVRRERAAELWAPDARRLSEASLADGRDAIETGIGHVHDGCAAGGFAYVSAGMSQEHHQLVRFKWQLQAGDGQTVAATGSNLLILDDTGLIRFDYLFDEPIQPGR